MDLGEGGVDFGQFIHFPNRYVYIDEIKFEVSQFLFANKIIQCKNRGNLLTY